ncbi:dethiobiotin synthase [Chitinophaga ginsengisoli]|uniref:ATP-dependent dethiobiotin synthetase BioD n=1 Tax=Chitinophaga ginsengisoli TaxID=363837 RepID=A0A2P8FF17_9BACT|nr:dethiobiotin synthase [Chitinophaga ginsengisoli]PSL20315.1 dethiobiotin synthetase [Chitinophaga ginsengisoli]
MSERIFITGIGTGVGKTVTSACVVEALQADYWKPVQTGLKEGTDTDTVKSLISNPVSVCHREAYCLEAPASPHLAARLEDVNINVKRILELAHSIQPSNRSLVIEGAGGLMVPLTEQVFTIDFIQQLEAKVIIVAQNYLGSINHALLTARVLKQHAIPVLGWIFSGEYHSNETEVIGWSGYPLLGRIPHTGLVDRAFVKEQAEKLSLW